MQVLSGVATHMVTTTAAGKEGAPDMLYDEFLPYLYSQYEGIEHKQFGSFGAAVDEFFATIESQKIAAQKFAQEVFGIALYVLTSWFIGRRNEKSRESESCPDAAADAAREECRCK